ncbi:MAG: polyprenyl synthetase family protein [Anaerolineae bacterium]|nr:polyprenyl synthetase family protein [Anaerolineae bacterium]
MNDLLKQRAQLMIAAVEDEMRSVLELNNSAETTSLNGMIHYHMGWVDAEFKPALSETGKRIRPLVCLLACEAAGGNWRQAVPVAAAIEILHNFSLVHDDIEDRSPTRRGRKTVWAIWGMPQAINTGDAMYAYSHLAIGRLLDLGIAPATVVTAMRRFDETCIALTQGQYADMVFETRDLVSVDEYIAMIRGKTAVLLSLSTELGALIAGSAADKIAHYTALGLQLGLAFQVMDDILGIWGDEAKIGKSAESDILTKKKTLPILYGLNQSGALRELYTKSAETPGFVEQTVQLLEDTDALAYAQERAAAYSESALAHLEAAQPIGDAGIALRSLVDMLLNRQS